MESLKSSICSAKVFHARLAPRKNSFTYQLYYLLLDIDAVDKNAIATKLFSHNKFNLFSFYNRDHCKHNNENSRNLRQWVENALQPYGIRPYKIMLMCHPRLFGYVFNPVSFWFCLNNQDELVAIVAEVQNTFGEAHSYIICDDGKVLNTKQYFAPKEFHVSPFFKREGKYLFKFDYSHKKISAFIDYYVDEKLMLRTSLIASPKPLCDKALLKAFFTIPLLTFKVIFLIHYQALKLVLKRIKYIPKPKALSKQITKIFHE